MNVSMQQLASWSGGTLQGAGNEIITSVSQDTRTIVPGALYVAIRGEHFDGHAFLDAAFEAGAVAALVEDAEALGNRPGLVVNNTIEALSAMAHAYRHTLDIPWIAITGSNGKTTTREMLRVILEQRGPVACSIRSFNNHIGVPLTILNTPDNAWAGIIEVGTNAPGEVAALARIIDPTLAIITSIGHTHLEGLETCMGVATEKAALLAALPTTGLAVFPSGPEYFDIFRGRTPCQFRTFSLTGCADILAQEIYQENNGMHFRAWDMTFQIPALGRHNVSNALPAIVVADWLGILPEESAKALQCFVGASGRLQIRHMGSITVIDDTFNANPDSMEAGFDALMAISASRHVAILGEMLELGDATDTLHRRVGMSAARAGVQCILAVGRNTVALAEGASRASASCTVGHYFSKSALRMRLRSLIRPGDVVFVKGSHGARMDTVIDDIKEIFASPHHTRAENSTICRSGHDIP